MMALKRPLSEAENDYEADASGGHKRRRSTLLESLLEPQIRKSVREGVDLALNSYLGKASVSQVECSGRRPLHLQFLGNMSSTLFTNSRIVSEDESTIKLVLCDADSKEIVQSHPLSNIKVSIVALDGVFCFDNVENWKKEDFDRKIVQKREGKRPLIIGDLIVQLKYGVGYIGEISFTDNSKWTRNGKFRLGAIAQTHSDQIKIREGISNAFKVKDHRGELYQKRTTPSLFDPVWRLKKIAKDGAYHKKLSKYNIHCVEDLLLASENNKDFLLKTVLGNISDKMWKVIIGHANLALEDKKPLSMTANCNGLLSYLVGVTSDGQDLCPSDYYDETQWRLAEDLRQHDPYIVGPSMPKTKSGADDLIPYSNLEDGLMLGNQGQLDKQINPYHPFGQLPSYLEASQDSTHQVHVFHPSLKKSYGMNDSQGEFNLWTDVLPSENISMTPLLTGYFPVDNGLSIGSSECPKNGLFIGSSSKGFFSSNYKAPTPWNEEPKNRWCKVLAVVKWSILMKRNLTSAKWKRFLEWE